jgi:Tripartite tricarboxylate transporter family receptor
VPNIMEVSRSLPAKTVPDFIAYAKANPGKHSFASSGIGTSLHMSGELFKARTNIDMLHVPYRGLAAGGYPRARSTWRDCSRGDRFTVEYKTKRAALEGASRRRLSQACRGATGDGPAARAGGDKFDPAGIFVASFNCCIAVS